MHIAKKIEEEKVESNTFSTIFQGKRKGKEKFKN